MVVHQKGDLVHIPQAVILVDCDNDAHSDPQLTIPLRIQETESPRIGIVTASPIPGSHYIRVFCDGNMWSVKTDSLFGLKKERDHD
jgi:hypothetical protein